MCLAHIKKEGIRVVHDGMNYAPKGKPNPVVKKGEFIFAAACLDHGHIYGMCNGLLEAGATLKWVYDPDPLKVAKFLETFPEVMKAESLDQILLDTSVRLVAGAAIPSKRSELGIQVMNAGKGLFYRQNTLYFIRTIGRNKGSCQANWPKVHGVL